AEATRGAVARSRAVRSLRWSSLGGVARQGASGGGRARRSGMELPGSDVGDHEELVAAEVECCRGW
ncbi:hypothetical protein ABZU45_41955, partial [Streptomyces avermitilis]|uniref:hypothetical protein n=1 Tax=Streptomyces avermitilis TaxID=33903 RepID=UPI0033B59F36